MSAAVKAFVVTLIERIKQLEDQVQTLTPRNSSMPPSAEHPHAKPKRKPSRGKRRKQGGQKGHKKHTRDLVPSDECNEVIPCQPEAC